MDLQIFNTPNSQEIRSAIVERLLELRAHRGNAKETMTLQKFQKLYGTSVLRDVLGKRR